MSRRIGVTQTIALAIVVGVTMNIPNQGSAREAANIQALEAISRDAEEHFLARRGPAWQMYAGERTGPFGMLNASEDVALIGVEADGSLIYYGTDNINAALTTRTNTLWPGGISGHNLTGANTFTMAIWDGGVVRASHQEFGGRVILQNTGTPAGHATHVGGTMMASGVVASAKGMSPEAFLFSYDWDNDTSEMASAASSLHVSNHSYGRITGWRYDSGDWYWYGNTNISLVEDYGFGFYDSQAATWDLIAYNAPHYMICKSAGNDRSDSGPNVGQSYFINFGSGWVQQNTDAPPRDGGPEGWDTVSWYSTSKNIMTIGAVADLPSGVYTGPGSVGMTSFSGWGPVDDGRIKPDVVANGQSLYSTYSGSDTDYASSSGTSMSTPNFSGTANLLFQHYYDTHDEMARAATIKAVVIHTADECGPAPGPDYMFGWGLVNAHAAADLISQDVEQDFHIQELTLAQDDTLRFLFYTTGEEAARVTISWTDPPGTPVPASLDPPNPMLVNDLDLRLIQISDGNEHMPWVLDRDNPGSAATFNDNVVDNSEQVFLAAPSEGEYVVQISHKELLESGSQDFSLVVTGMFWLDDPRIPPENLTADLSLEEGSVSLEWTQEGMEEEGFLGFTVYRDGQLLGSTESPSWQDQLPGFGFYRYTVSSSWQMGASSLNPSAEVFWAEPLAPILPGVTVLDTLSGLVEVTWEQIRPYPVRYDDGDSDVRIYFSSGATPGMMVVRSFEVTGDWDRVYSINAFLLEGSAGFGELEYVLFRDHESGERPGEEVYRTEPLLPESEGWHELLVEAGEGIPVTVGEQVWAGVAWRQPGRTELGLDTSAPLEPISHFSSNGTSWISLSDFLSGVYEGNPMIRLAFGVPEEIGENGLLQYSVGLQGETAETTEERRFEFTLTASEPCTVLIHAHYLQGDAGPTELIVEPFSSWLPDLVSQPQTWEIGQAYPNPFNPVVSLPVSLAERGRIQLVVYDVLGREVSDLSTEARAAGRHLVSWDATGLASGVYFLKVTAGPETALLKVVLLR